MLDPQERQLLRDALRPPPGYQLDRAVMTTYSLDLMTLLTIPLAFTFFQMKDDGGPLSADPLALLEALRRHARRLTVFCQGGQIHLPKNVQRLLGYLEGSVHQVTSPRGGVFHPKVAVLRFVRNATAEELLDDGPDDQVRYRLLCSSRNLTFDRSWDTLLTLEGPLSQTRRNAYARNRPLGAFIRSLPGLLLDKAAAAEMAHVEQVADELLRVDFDLPAGFDELEFVPIGIEGGAMWPMLDYGKSVVISPFVGDGFVEQLTADDGEHVLISRHESLDQLSEASLSRLSAAYYMNTAADPADPAAEASEADAAETGDEDRPVHVEPSHQLNGLHAKLFVVDDGWNAHVWTGSANATPAAFEKNVEFLVCLSGKKRLCGVHTLIDNSNGTGEDDGKVDKGLRLSDLLLRYERSGPPIVDELQNRVEQALEEARSALVGAAICASVTRLDEKPEHYRLELKRAGGCAISWPTSVTVECNLITLRDAWVPLAGPLGGRVVCFEPLSFEALTSFVAFRLTAREGDRQEQCGFVLNLAVDGMPQDRESRMLLSMLRSRQQLLRYLLLLLADDEENAAKAIEVFGADRQTGDAGTGDGSFDLPLLEPMLKALDRQPQKLEQISRLIDDLRTTDEGRTLVTDEFMHIWAPIWKTAATLSGRGEHE